MINIFVRHSKTLLFVSLIFFFKSVGAQESVGNKNKQPFPIKYTSTVDQKILMKTITLAPVYDNVSGVYSEPIEKMLIDLLENDKTFGYSKYNFSKKFFIENFDYESKEVLSALKESDAHGMLTAFITKGPRGLSAKLKLFTQDEGYLLIEESFQDINTFEVSKLREKFIQMYLSIKNKLPYYGYVLSRRGLDITINLGTMNGLSVGQEITLAQILKINRHPKLKFMVGVEKEIIAKAKILKVESYLAFAQITFEKETGVVSTGTKVLPTDFVAYPVPQINSAGQVTGDLPPQSFPKNIALTESKNDSDSVQQSTEDKKNELLDRENTTGYLTAQGVVTQYNESSALISGNTASASQNMALGLNLGFYYKIKQSYFFDLGLQMNSFSADNGLNASTPFSLSYTYTRYAGLFGYNYSYKNWALSAALGYSNLKTAVSDSTPTALTNTNTSGFLLQLKGETPLTHFPVTMGGKFEMLLSPSFSESPVNSGSAKASLTSFGVYGLYTYSNNIRLRADLTMSTLSATFSGAGTRTDPSTKTSIQTTSEYFGLEYLF